MRSDSFRRKSRWGFTLVELLAAMVVLTTVIGLVTGLSVRISRVWKDIGHCQIAVAELSNQLDRLTRLEPQQAEEAILALQPSEHCRRTLANPQLAGQLAATDIGLQITLQLNWDRYSPGKPIQLAGWIAGIPPGSED